MDESWKGAASSCNLTPPAEEDGLKSPRIYHEVMQFGEKSAFSVVNPKRSRGSQPASNLVSDSLLLRPRQISDSSELSISSSNGKSELARQLLESDSPLHHIQTSSSDSASIHRSNLGGDSSSNGQSALARLLLQTSPIHVFIPPSDSASKSLELRESVVPTPIPSTVSVYSSDGPGLSSCALPTKQQAALIRHLARPAFSLPSNHVSSFTIPCTVQSQSSVGPTDDSLETTCTDQTPSHPSSSPYSSLTTETIEGTIALTQKKKAELTEKFDGHMRHVRAEFPHRPCTMEQVDTLQLSMIVLRRKLEEHIGVLDAEEVKMRRELSMRKSQSAPNPPKQARSEVAHAQSHPVAGPSSTKSAANPPLQIRSQMSGVSSSQSIHRGSQQDFQMPSMQFLPHMPDGTEFKMPAALPCRKALPTEDEKCIVEQPRIAQLMEQLIKDRDERVRKGIPHVILPISKELSVPIGRQ